MIREIVCLITGRRYRWRVEVEYRNAANRPLGSIEATVSLNHPGGIEQHRNIKIVLSQDLITSLGAKRLCNGTIVVRPLCYLGWF